MKINERIIKIIRHFGLTNSEFAEKIDVQPSAISHILSGRNRPSIDFILKIKSQFPSLSLDWILIGNGTMEMDENGAKTPLIEDEKNNLFSEEKEAEKTLFSTPTSDTFFDLDLPSPTEDFTPSPTPPIIQNEEKKQSEIEKIIILYKDGTFKNYNEQ